MMNTNGKSKFQAYEWVRKKRYLLVMGAPLYDHMTSWQRLLTVLLLKSEHYFAPLGSRC